MSNFTESILSSINHKDLRKKLRLDRRNKYSSPSQVEWIRKGLQNVHRVRKEVDSRPAYPHSGDDDKPYQQTDVLRDFYLAIAQKGLAYTYEHCPDEFEPDHLPFPGMRKGKDSEAHVWNKLSSDPIIIVGAGMSGLVAAYELTKAGYNVQILEMSQRFGGRVKTLDQKDGFDRGLHVDAGAMRVPQPPPPPGKERPVPQMIHYLTDYYAMKEFKLDPVPFKNKDDNAFYYFYGHRTKIDEWDHSQFSKYWPNWDHTLKKNGKRKDISGLDCYFEKTTDVVIECLKIRLDGVENVCDIAVQWDEWTKNWSQFSVGSFLRNDIDGIISRVNWHIENRSVASAKLKDTITELKNYLPWPEIAITGYCVWAYTLSTDLSLVAFLQEKMGKWWTKPKNPHDITIHSYCGGLSEIPKAFAAAKPAKPAKPGDKTVEEMITYNRTVMKVEYTWTSNTEKSVTVSGVITSSNQPFSVTGRSIILTVPLHVLRGIEIVDASDKPDFPKEFQQAIQDISYTPSTKIMLQYKEQFWNNSKDPKTDITGGFSKTNLPIGQLHYPTEVVSDGKGGWIPKPVTTDEKGILMVYTWDAEALLWGALEESQAIMQAVNQIEEIHPDSSQYFEVGRRQAWASDPTTLGAFVKLRPNEYVSVMYLMQHSWRNVYFAGEAISFANGWIQGALESGLRAAYQLFRDDQSKN